MLVIKTKIQTYIFPAMFVFFKINIFNYQVFKIESCQRISKFWVGASWVSGWWSGGQWSLDLMKPII